VRRGEPHSQGGRGGGGGVWGIGVSFVFFFRCYCGYASRSFLSYRAPILPSVLRLYFCGAFFFPGECRWWWVEGWRGGGGGVWRSCRVCVWGVCDVMGHGRWGWMRGSSCMSVLLLLLLLLLLRRLLAFSFYICFFFFFFFAACTTGIGLGQPTEPNQCGERGATNPLGLSIEIDIYLCSPRFPCPRPWKGKNK